MAYQYQHTSQLQNSAKGLLCNWLKNTKEAVIYLSLDYQIREFNPVSEKLFGITRKEAIDKNYFVICEKLGIIPPFSHSQDIPSILDGQALTNVETVIDFNSLVFTWIVSCTLNADDIIEGIILVGQDITELKQTQIALQKAEEYKLGTNRDLAEFSQLVTGQNIPKQARPVEYTKNIYHYMENIVAKMPVSVYWMNKKGIYLGCNDRFAALFNLKSRHDILGKTYKDLYDEESGKFYQSVDTEVMNTGTARILEEPFSTPDGTETIWLSSKAPLLDASGQVIGMLGTSLDITERKKTELALKEAKERAEIANLAKSEFLAMVSHELRIPITSILGMTKLLDSKNLPDFKQQEYLQHISTAGMHLLNLINDTLDFAKLEAAQLQLSSAPMDLRGLIEETATMLTPLAKDKNLELLINFEQTVPHKIFGDKRLLRQILINLIGNAIKFTEQGYISIQIDCIERTSQHAKLAISISDTGIGIREENQGMIFDFFSQVDSSHSRKHGGVGLGLTITKQLVELMSGTISVSSQLNRGSTFRCVINFLLQNEAITHAPWMAYESEVRILIVDDTLRGSVIQKQLSASNSQVVSGEQALSTLLAANKLSDPYDVVILDQGLETIDAFKLAKHIHQHSELLCQPMLIALVEDGAANTRESAKAGSFFECITKPIQPLALQVALTAAWERWVEQKETRMNLPVSSEKIKVLLVEDEPVVQIIHHKYLEDLNCIVDLAKNGKEALEKLENYYDLVFLDMGLPDISGIDIIREFRKRTCGKKQTPVIALTGYGAESDKQEFMEAGVDEVLVKPVFIEQLEQTIQKYCEAKSTQHQFA